MAEKKWLVMAQYYVDIKKSPFAGDYPRAMGFYEADTAENAFNLFLAEFAPTVQRAQIFYNDITVIPCSSSTGYQFTMRDRFGDLARFPDTDTRNWKEQ